MLFRCFEFDYLCQNVRLIIPELDLKRNARSQTRVSTEEIFHFVRISGEDDDRLFAVVLHLLDYRVYRFVTETVVPVFHERIGFIYEEQLSISPLENVLYLFRRLSLIFTDKIRSSDLDDLVTLEEADLIQDACEDPRDRSLSGSGVSHEAGVESHVEVCDAFRRQRFFHACERRDLHDLFLNVFQPDQLVELVPCCSFFLFLYLVSGIRLKVLFVILFKFFAYFEDAALTEIGYLEKIENSQIS